MHICIDSSVFIIGLREIDPNATKILELIGNDLNLIIPRLVAQEVTRNLATSGQVRQFYRLFQKYNFARIIDEPVPPLLVNRYVVFVDENDEGIMVFIGVNLTAKPLPHLELKV